MHLCRQIPKSFLRHEVLLLDTEILPLASSCVFKYFSLTFGMQMRCLIPIHILWQAVVSSDDGMLPLACTHAILYRNLTFSMQFCCQLPEPCLLHEGVSSNTGAILLAWVCVSRHINRKLCSCIYSEPNTWDWSSVALLIHYPNVLTTPHKNITFILLKE